MSDQNVTAVPQHLQELIPTTPSGVLKLLAAWDGLSVETQILLLSERKRYRSGFFLLFNDKRILEKALSSPNEFVRYLAAREIKPYDDKNCLKAQIKNDTSLLVKYAHLEDYTKASHDLDDPKEFFSMPHEARLSLVRNLVNRGLEISNLVIYAVEELLPQGKISEYEISEMLEDYLAKPNFYEFCIRSITSRDYWNSSEITRDDIKALWKIVICVPEEISFVLVQNLPVEIGFSTMIPSEIIDKMSDRQLGLLFRRHDVDLKKLRKTIFFEILNSDDSASRRPLQLDVTTYAFDLTVEEFKDILSKPKENTLQALSILSTSGGLRLCIYAAIEDLSYKMSFEAETSQLIFNRLSVLEGDQKKREKFELSIYRLAASLSSKKEDISFLLGEKLAFLSHSIIEGDTWGTFMNFYDKIGLGMWLIYSIDQLNEHLPTHLQQEKPIQSSEDKLGILINKIFDERQQLISEELANIKNLHQNSTMTFRVLALVILAQSILLIVAYAY